MPWKIPSDVPILLPLRRFWPPAVALALFVALAAGAQFVAAPRHYTASQALQLSVLPSAGGGALNGEALDADAAARALASTEALASPRLASAVLAHFSAREQAAQHMSVPALETTLSATHTDATIVLSALWSSPTGAQQILAAAVDTLQRDNATLAALAPTAGSARVQADGAASPATRAAGEEESVRQTLITRLLLGLIAAALLPFALALIVTTRPTSGAPAVGQ